MNDRGRSTRALSTSATLLAAGLLLGSSVGSVDAGPDVRLLQADPAPLVDTGSSTVGDVAGASPTVSGDGRFVVFHGAPGIADAAADDPVDADARTSTIYLTDRETDETIELTQVPTTVRSGDSRYPVISGDGCVVVAVSEIQLDVFRDDDSGARWDVYRTRLPHCGGNVGDWELVSTRDGTGGLARDDVIVAPVAVDRSATLIAYTHPADHLYEAEGVTTVSLVDLAVTVGDPNRSRFVAGMPTDTPNTLFVHRGIDQPTLSADGSHLAYRSDADSTQAVPGWGTGLVEGGPATTQVFVWEIGEPDPFLAVDLVSARPDGTPSVAGASEPDISRDGTVIAFTSPDTGLAIADYPTCATDCPAQVFVLDRDTDDDGVVEVTDVAELRIVSVADDTEPPLAGSAPSSDPAISGDGQMVAFVSRSPNLQLIQAPGVGSGPDGEILVAELERGALTRLTTGVDGIVPTPGVHAHPDLSDSGRVTVFDTSAAAALLGTAPVEGRQVVATSSPPRLSLAQANLGSTLVGLESDEWFVAVLNDGPATFQPSEVVISNPQFTINEETSSCLLAADVPAGGSCTVAIRFTPRSAGETDAMLTVSETGFGAESVSTRISGIGGEPALKIDPAGIDFPEVEVGRAGVELQVDVLNVAYLPVTLGRFDVTGPHAGDFELTSNNCYARPINPRAACSVGITFTPSDSGRRTALLELETKTGQVTTAIIAGDGRFSPVVELDTAEILAGAELVASGNSFPADTEVTVVFGDGPSGTVTAVTDSTGSFRVPVPVTADERGGDRRIVVQSTSGAAATAPVEVISVDQQLVGMPGFGLG